MPSPSEIVDFALRQAGVPIVGASVGDPADRSTWRVRYDPSATPAQQSQGATLIATLDLTDATRLAAMADAAAQAMVNDNKLQAVAQALWECIPSPLMTKAQLKARAIAIYKTL